MTKPSDAWYLAPKGDAHAGVFQTVNFIRNQQSTLREDMLFHMELYAAGNVTGLWDGSASQIADQLESYLYGSGLNTRFNLVAAMVDTACSLISQSPVVPMVLTTDGDFALIRKAERRSQVLQGQLNKDRQETIKRVFLDAAKVGTGIIHGYHDEDGLPEAERVHPLEMFVEHMDGLYKAPRSMHRMKLVAREILKAAYPQHKSAIDGAPCASMDAINTFLLTGLAGSYGDFVEVVESHHLAAGPKSKGRHTICIPSATLLDEEYKHRKHPYVVFRYRDRDFGFWGSGLAESCRAAQNRINELISRVTRAQDLGSSLVLMNPAGESQTAVRVDELSNELGLIVNYDPAIGEPHMVTWNGTLDDLQEQINLEYQRALLAEGLSQEQVNGQGAGRGLESGVAVRAADDVQSRRLVPYVSSFQQSCLEVARLFERLNDDAAEADPNFSISGERRAGARTFLRTSRWADLAIENGTAQITMSQMSALPTTPAGRWAAALEWVQSGFISKQYAVDLMGMPDLDAFAAIENAHLEIAKWQIEQMLDGIAVDPIPRQNIQVAMDLATRSELQAITMGATPEVIDLFESFLTYCQQLMDKAAPPPAPAAPGMAPPAALAGAAPPPMLQPAPQMAPGPAGAPMPSGPPAAA